MPFLSHHRRVEADSPLVGGRADRLVQELVQQSRSFVTGLFDHDCVTLNGAMEPDAGRRLQVGDEVLVRYEADRRYSPRPRPRASHTFETEFEDEYLIVVHKPPELLTVPTNKRESNTLVDRITAYLKRGQARAQAHVVHRLDRGVSGLLVFAKSTSVSELLQAQFALQKPERCYAAIVKGQLEPAEGQFRSYLATGKTLTRFSTRDSERGEYAETVYRTIRSWKDATQVEVELVTGRRNQIRVHFSEAGHPVLGDDRYQPEIARHRRWPHKRLALHAQTLGFEHPITRETLRFETPLPSEFQHFGN